MVVEIKGEFMKVREKKYFLDIRSGYLINEKLGSASSFRHAD